MPLRQLPFPTPPALAGAVAALLLLPACVATPPAERVAPILLTEDDGTRRGAAPGARPVELPDPATAGADTEPPARRESPVAPEPERSPNLDLDPPEDDDTDGLPEPRDDPPDGVDDDGDDTDDDDDRGDDEDDEDDDG